MILYNVTINVDEDVEQDWIRWMKETHIPEVMATGFFKEHRMMKMLTEHDKEKGKTYSIQYLAESLADVETYLNSVAVKLQKAFIIRYGSKLAAFQTVLEEV